METYTIHLTDGTIVVKADDVKLVEGLIFFTQSGKTVAIVPPNYIITKND